MNRAPNGSYPLGILQRPIPRFFPTAKVRSSLSSNPSPSGENGFGENERLPVTGVRDVKIVFLIPGDPPDLLAEVLQL